jgi:hypothetical protein
MARSEIKYTQHFLNKLEDLFAESDYVLRYEKGNFKSGYCILKDTKIVIINKYYPLVGKINCLLDIIKLVDLNIEDISDKNRKFLLNILERPSTI